MKRICKSPTSKENAPSMIKQEEHHESTIIKQIDLINDQISKYRESEHSKMRAT